MFASWDTFERYRQKGLDARRAGQWDSARIYLLEAARAIVQLSKTARGPELAQARKEMGAKLLDLARDCQTAAQSGDLSAQKLVTIDTKGITTAANWIVQEKPRVRFDDIAGLDDVKELIRLRMIYPFTHPDLAERFDIHPGGGVLLYGPPGTGKTLLARATAGEIDATFYHISAADILSKWVGEAEQNIQKLFAAAAQEPRAILFIDEIEALLPARRDDGSSVMQRVVPQLLQEMEGFANMEQRNLLIIGATNVPWQLDPAVLRPGRFDEKIYIPLPDLPSRMAMLEMFLLNRPIADDVNLESLATRLDGYSGADIKYLCDRAATIPFLQCVATGQDCQITAPILDEVRTQVHPSVTPEMLALFDQWR